MMEIFTLALLRTSAIVMWSRVSAVVSSWLKLSLKTRPSWRRDTASSHHQPSKLLCRALSREDCTWTAIRRLNWLMIISDLQPIANSIRPKGLSSRSSQATPKSQTSSCRTTWTKNLSPTFFKSKTQGTCYHRWKVKAPCLSVHKVKVCSS